MAGIPFLKTTHEPTGFEPWIFEFDDSGAVIDLKIENISSRESDSYLPEKYHVKK